MLLTLVSLLSFSQIKLHQNGTIAIGSIDSSRSNVEMRGDILFSKTINTITSSPLIVGTNTYSSSLTPGYTFFNDENTGIYHPTQNNLGFAVNGISRILLNSNGNVFTDDFSAVTSGGFAAMIRSRHALSTKTDPDYTYYNDDQTGLYHPAISQLGFTVGGTSRLIMTSTGNLFTDNMSQLTSGSGGSSAAFIRSKHSYLTATAPDYSWYNNDNTGMYHPQHNEICFSIDGNDALCMDWSWNSGLNVQWHTSTNKGTWRIKRGDRLPSATREYFDFIFDPAMESGIINSGTGMVKFYNHEEESYNDIYFGEAYQLSDRNHKKNIKKLPKVVADKVYLLDAKSFKYKKDTLGNTEHFGLIAQEIELIYPHLVNTNSNGEKSVNYIAIIPLLIEAIKEQQAEITNLGNQLNRCCTSNNGQGNTKSSRLKDPTTADATTVIDSELKQNVPNPFKQNTTISYFIPEANFNNAELYILNMNGVLLQTHSISATGEGAQIIEGNTLSAGMYL